MTIANLVTSFILVYQCINVLLDLFSRLVSARNCEQILLIVQFGKHSEMVGPDKYILAYKRRENMPQGYRTLKTYTPCIKV